MNSINRNNSADVVGSDRDEANIFRETKMKFYKECMTGGGGGGGLLLTSHTFFVTFTVFES